MLAGDQAHSVLFRGIWVARMSMGALLSEGSVVLRHREVSNPQLGHTNGQGASNPGAPCSPFSPLGPFLPFFPFSPCGHNGVISRRNFSATVHEHVVLGPECNSIFLYVCICLMCSACL